MIFRRKSKLKVIIVGLPRSGTSFLTSLVYKLTGYNVGVENELKSADVHNKYGYFEFVQLMSISDEILNKQGGDFHEIPNFEFGWEKKYEKEKKRIKKIVSDNKLELYKDNKVLCLANIYNDLFPDAKWIFIKRNIHDTYKSRFGEFIDFDKWEIITNRRLECWNDSKPSKEALSLNYEDFFNNLPKVVESIIDHLEIKVSQEKKEECYELFRPNKK